MANFNINKVILGGRLTADVELKSTPSGVSVAQFSLAVNRSYSKDGQQQTDFINCTAWRQTAEFISRYFRKGSALCITGSIQTRSWQDQQGQKRYTTEVVADEAMFVDSKNEGGAVGGQYADSYNAPSYSSAPASAPKFEELKTDDDLPF
jgi:single-strand DNA-binding protein